MTKATDPTVVIFKKAVQLLAKLTEEQIAQLVEGKGELRFVTPDEMVATGKRSGGASTSRSTRSAKQKPDVAEVAERLPRSADAAEARQYLVETGLTVLQLKQVAKLLNLTVRNSKRDPLLDELVGSVVGYRAKHEAVLGGPYRP